MTEIRPGRQYHEAHTGRKRDGNTPAATPPSQGQTRRFYHPEPGDSPQGREIGLRRAVGARKQDIRNQFLMEAVILSSTGGLIGVAMGIGGAFILSQLGYWQTVISWSAAAFSFLFSASLGTVFGIYPAMRAANLEPIDPSRRSETIITDLVKSCLDIEQSLCSQGISP